MLERIDIIPDLIPMDQIFTNVRDCLTWVKENVKDEFPKMESEHSRMEADV